MDHFNSGQIDNLDWSRGTSSLLDRSNGVVLAGDKFVFSITINDQRVILQSEVIEQTIQLNTWACIKIDNDIAYIIGTADLINKLEKLLLEKEFGQLTKRNKNESLYF